MRNRHPPKEHAALIAGALLLLMGLGLPFAWVAAP